MSSAHRVLVVEDDSWLAEQHQRVLDTAGYQVTIAPHAVAAMTLLDEQSFDVLLLDVLLSGPNAFSLLHELQSYKDFAAMAVILCTNSAADLADEDVHAYGVVHVLDKATMHPGDVVSAVKKALL